MAGSWGIWAIIQGILTMLLCAQTNYLFPFFSQLIRELYSVTEASANGEDQSQKGTQLLEIYALEIQMHNETRNYKELKASDAF
jgi:hypothetical protein